MSFTYKNTQFIELHNFFRIKTSQRSNSRATQPYIILSYVYTHSYHTSLVFLYPSGLAKHVFIFHMHKQESELCMLYDLYYCMNIPDV